MADSHPPDDAAFAFLWLLNRTVADFRERLVPVARGSILLRHWLGDDARPAADLDLECFQRPRGADGDDEEDDFDEDYELEIEEGRFGRDGEYESLVDFGKAMCRYAANESRYRRRGRPDPEFQFEPTDPPAGGVSLWTYGTPGERYFAGWTRTGGATGRLQIDIAQSGYALDSISTTLIAVDLDGKPVDCPAYAPEALLAAKLSWLIRGVKRDGAAIAWAGEPKDLFDAHLILTRLELEPLAFRKSLLAMGTQDGLDWNNIDTLFAAAHTLKDENFTNWPAFRKTHKDIIESGPAEMLRELVEELEPLLGNFYRKDEMPFVRAINADPADETALLVYADFLDDRGQAACADLVRRYAKFVSRPRQVRRPDRDALLRALDAVPAAWLCQLFGTSKRLAELRERLAPKG